MYFDNRLLAIMTGLLLPLLLNCSSTPEFDTSNVDSSLTPRIATADTASEQETRGKTALWGGTVLDVRNLKDSTRLEVLAYPLNTYQRPMSGMEPQGRFLVIQDGYLEPTNYAPGRSVTVLGVIDDVQSGKVGESHYRFPVIRAQQMHLWPVESESRSHTGFHLGIGIGL